MTLGLETLDVANLHAQALTALAPLGGSSGTAGHKTTERAKVFFAEVIVPIETTHRAALKAKVRIDQLTRTLQRSARDSSAADRKLNRAIAQRQATEAALKQGAEHDAKLLAEADEVQRDLRKRLREILSTQEDEREGTSRELRDEVAQAMLAIDLSLLALKTSANANREELWESIAKVQRLVEESPGIEGA